MKKLICIVSMVVVFNNVALAATTPTTGFVRQADTVNLDTNGSRIEFPKAADKRFSLSITYVTATGRESLVKDGFFKKDGWFVYVESASRIWIFDGERQFDLFSNERPNKGFYSVGMNRIFETCPKVVWDALPEKVRKRYQEKREA